MKYLVTGGAGFIGSEICEMLVKNNDVVICFDDLSSGYLKNIESLMSKDNFAFIKGDIRNFKEVVKATIGVDVIIHQAALVSVPKSIEEPLLNNEKNVDGFINILEAARINNVKRVVYASSSAVYGDNEDEEKVESRIGRVISPYALSKYMDELYASLYSRLYNLETVGLRYFNVYGPKQDPSSVYSGVISIFIDRILKGENLKIYGDGSITRDFVNVKDVARANYLAATKTLSTPEVFNIGTNRSISIKELGETLIKITESKVNIEYLPPRLGDIKYSKANINKAKTVLGFTPEITIEEGLKDLYLSLSKK